MSQDKATSGKQGLGIKDRPKKVAGCYFQGKKTSFNDSSDDDSSNSGSLKRKCDDMLQRGKAGKQKLNLKKLCKQLLRQASPSKLGYVFNFFKVTICGLHLTKKKKFVVY